MSKLKNDTCKLYCNEVYTLNQLDYPTHKLILIDLFQQNNLITYYLIDSITELLNLHIYIHILHTIFILYLLIKIMFIVNT